jgi:acetoacetyl-CoA synthetase
MSVLLRHAGAEDYNALWQWSVDDLPRFWRWIWDRYDVQADGDPTTVLGSDAMPGATWFPGVTLSFPEHVFRDRDAEALAIQFASETQPLDAWTWGRLRDETARVRAALVRMGVGLGDCVAGYAPNAPETVAAFLATASLGAIWSCCSPDFGARAVGDRFAQITPKVLLAVSGYSYGGKWYDRSAVVDELATSLPSLEHVVHFDTTAGRPGWDAAFPATEDALAFVRVPFDHPLWIVYSSGTTGAPKAIVHGHGGPLLEHLKMWRLHHDARPGDRMLWFTTTGWIMWNYLVCALLSPVSVVLYDGNPGYPSLDALWDLCEEAEVSLLGAGAAFLHACMSAGIEPREGRDLAHLRSIGITGSPLAVEAYDWVRDHVGESIWLASTSGGTDIAGAFLGGSPLMPVHPGELACRLLGVHAEAWNEAGQPVVDEMGELVITAPMPSMPVFLWDDPGNERYRATYFDTYPGAWRHGDWVRITSRGSAVIYGRSDATINRGGIRMGTAEIYRAIADIDELKDALVVDVPPDDGIGNSQMILFAVVADGVVSAPLVAEIRSRIARRCSSRHVPDEIVAVPAVPRTLTGKLLEVPVKALLMGRSATTAANAGALTDPDAFTWFVEYAARYRTGPDR